MALLLTLLAVYIFGPFGSSDSVDLGDIFSKKNGVIYIYISGQIFKRPLDGLIWIVHSHVFFWFLSFFPWSKDPGTLTNQHFCRLHVMDFCYSTKAWKYLDTWKMRDNDTIAPNKERGSFFSKVLITQNPKNRFKRCHFSCMCDWGDYTDSLETRV